MYIHMLLIVIIFSCAAKVLNVELTLLKGTKDKTANEIYKQRTLAIILRCYNQLLFIVKCILVLQKASDNEILSGILPAIHLIIISFNLHTTKQYSPP